MHKLNVHGFPFLLGETLKVVDSTQYVLCKDAYCIPSKTRIGEADEGEVSEAFEKAYRAAHPGEYQTVL